MPRAQRPGERPHATLPVGILLDSCPILLQIPGQPSTSARAHPQIASELRAAADAIRGGGARGNAAADTRPLPVGDRQGGTELPAGDATVTGRVQRSNRFPNSSYFTAWSNTDAVVTWDVVVCNLATTRWSPTTPVLRRTWGSAIEVAFGDKRVTATIGQAHDPPVIGAPEDRVPRVECCVKDSSRFRWAGCTSTLVEGR